MRIPILNIDKVTPKKEKGILFIDSADNQLKLKTATGIIIYTGEFIEDENVGNENTGNEPTTPNYGEGALRVTGFTDYNNEAMQLSYPFSNFNGIYRKNSDSSYEKIYDLNNNPVSTPYYILMDTTNGDYWCLCETSTISHYHGSLAYHDGDSGVMPPTTENGITWFYSGNYSVDLNNFTIEEI